MKVVGYITGIGKISPQWKTKRLVVQMEGPTTFPLSDIPVPSNWENDIKIGDKITIEILDCDP